MRTIGWSNSAAGSAEHTEHTMTTKERLHLLVEALPESELTMVEHLLENGR